MIIYIRSLISYMNSMGVTEISDSPKKYKRRKLEFEFGSLLQFEDLLDNNKLFVILKVFQNVRYGCTIKNQTNSAS